MKLGIVTLIDSKTNIKYAPEDPFTPFGVVCEMDIITGVFHEHCLTVLGHYLPPQRYRIIHESEKMMTLELMKDDYGGSAEFVMDVIYNFESNILMYRCGDAEISLDETYFKDVYFKVKMEQA